MISKSLPLVQVLVLGQLTIVIQYLLFNLFTTRLARLARLAILVELGLQLESVVLA